MLAPSGLNLEFDTNNDEDKNMIKFVIFESLLVNVCVRLVVVLLDDVQELRHLKNSKSIFLFLCNFYGTL